MSEEALSAVEEVPSESPASEKATVGPVARISSLLFVAVKPVPAEVLADAAALDIVTAENALDQITELFQDEVHGFSLHEVAGGWQFRTAPGASAAIRRFIPRKGRRLSRAAAETLAIIAYKQPISRAEIEAIRGVDALPTLKTVLDAKLVRVIGRQDTPGQPALYGTTTKFLEKFGLRDLSDLPSIRELEQLLSEPGEGEDEGEDGDEGEDDNFSDDDDLEI